MLLLITSQSVPLQTTNDQLPRVPERASLAIQSEKLRMAVLEARDVGRVQQRVLGIGLAMAGTSLIVPSTFQLTSPDRTTLSTTLAAGDLTGGILMALTGVSILVGASASTGIAAENGLWLSLQKLEALRLKDPELHLAEAEGAFEAAVQRAGRTRRITAVGLGALGIAQGVFKAVVLGQANATRLEHALAQVEPTLVLGIGLLAFFAYRSPLEAAWESYLDDKHLEHPYLTLAPAVQAVPQGLTAGVSGTF